MVCERGPGHGPGGVLEAFVLQDSSLSAYLSDTLTTMSTSIGTRERTTIGGGVIQNLSRICDQPAYLCLL